MSETYFEEAKGSFYGAEIVLCHAFLGSRISPGAPRFHFLSNVVEQPVFMSTAMLQDQPAKSVPKLQHDMTIFRAVIAHFDKLTLTPTPPPCTEDSHP